MACWVRRPWSSQAASDRSNRETELSAQAQDIMFGPCTGVGTDIDGMSYQEIIQLSAMRIIASRQDPTHDKLAESPL